MNKLAAGEGWTYSGANPQAAPLSDLEAVFANIVKVALELAGIVLFVMLIIGGFKYLNSGGDPKAAEGAKKTITYAVVGLIFITLALLIMRFIKDFTGVDVTQFTITR
jgi:TRAP-type C4-dicarboxylate transport system permease small subunit